MDNKMKNALEGIPSELAPKVRIGIEALSILVSIGAPEQKIAAFVIATALRMPQHLAGTFIADATRRGLITEPMKQACLTVYREKTNTPTPVVVH